MGVSRDGGAAAIRFVQTREAVMAAGTMKTKGYGFIARRMAT
jgi:hypothetical protein